MSLRQFPGATRGVAARSGEAIAAAAQKLLDMPERLAALDEQGSPPAS